MSLAILEPSDREKSDLEVHVEMCHQRYANIASALSSIYKVLWVIASILLAGTISSSLAIWLK